MAKEKDAIDLTHFSIKITVEGIGIEITITTQDPLDCVVLAGRAIDMLRTKNYEPKVLILP